jgi:hypothetical protein
MVEAGQGIMKDVFADLWWAAKVYAAGFAVCMALVILMLASNWVWHHWP